MKTALRLLIALAPLGLIGCAGAPQPSTPPIPPTPTPPASPRTALDLLRKREPDVAWDSKSLIRGDFDQDGSEDFALAGTRGDLFVVGIVKGPVADACRHWTLEFSMAEGSQDGLCSREAKIQLEEITEDDPPGRKGLGINLHDDACDAFHIYWDPEQDAYDWWRL